MTRRPARRSRRRRRDSTQEHRPSAARDFTPSVVAASCHHRRLTRRRARATTPRCLRLRRGGRRRAHRRPAVGFLGAPRLGEHVGDCARAHRDRAAVVGGGHADRTRARPRASSRSSGLSGLPWAEAHDLSPKAHHHLSYDASAAAAAARSRPETPTAGAPSSAGGGGSGSASASASFKRRASPAASPARRRRRRRRRASSPRRSASNSSCSSGCCCGGAARRGRFFDAIAEPGERRLTRAEWQDAFGLGWNAPVVYRIFDVVDAERKGSLAKADFVDGLAPLVARDGAARLHFYSTCSTSTAPARSSRPTY